MSIPFVSSVTILTLRPTFLYVCPLAPWLLCKSPCILSSLSTFVWIHNPLVLRLRQDFWRDPKGFETVGSKMTTRGRTRVRSPGFVSTGREGSLFLQKIYSTSYGIRPWVRRSGSRSSDLAPVCRPALSYKFSVMNHTQPWQGQQVGGKFVCSF